MSKTAAENRIILGVTGSIAAYKSADILRRLRERGVRVTVVMTREAEAFITPTTLAALSGEPVLREFFDNNDESWRMRHLEAAEAADLILIAPATANIIGKLAHGISDDILTCTVLASPAKVVLAPAMNDRMFAHPIVQENCQRLKGFGMEIIEPVTGELACGRTGKGHIADVEDIVDRVNHIMRTTKTTRKGA